MLKRRDGFRRVTGSKLCFDVSNDHAGMAHDPARACNTLVQWRWSTLLQWIAGRNQPPDPVQAETLQRLSGDVNMAVVCRIKRPAEQADPQAARNWRKSQHPLSFAWFAESITVSQPFVNFPACETVV